MNPYEIIKDVILENKGMSTKTYTILILSLWLGLSLLLL